MKLGLGLSLPGVAAMGGKRDVYVRTTGASTSFVSTPDSAALDITGDLEIVLRVAMDDWTPVAYSTLVSKGSDAYEFAMGTSPAAGRLSFIYNTSGLERATATPTLVDGAAVWVKMTFDLDNGSSSRITRFFTAPNALAEPSSWTQVGADVTGAVVAAIATNAKALTVGVRSEAAFPAAANFFHVIVRSGIGGSAVLDWNLRRDGLRAQTGQTMTLNGDAAIGYTTLP